MEISIKLTKLSIYFLFYPMWGMSKVLELFSRQVRRQKVLRQRLRTPHGLTQSHKLQNSIRFNFIRRRFCQKLYGVLSRGQKVRFFHLVRADGWLDVADFFHTVVPIKMKLKTYHYFSKMKRWLLFGTNRPTNISTLFQYFFIFFSIS